MMRCDAEWLGKALTAFAPEELSPILNVGSSTKLFRTREQPHIQRLVFAPLESKGIRILHTDLKAAEGVDITCDIFDDAGFERLKAVRPKAVICTHMFEHVLDRAELSRRLLSLLPRNGVFFVTVPFSYHYHNDPIDTMYRPSPDELAALFPGQNVLEKHVLIGDTYWLHVRKRPFTIVFRHLARFCVPFLGWAEWKRSMRKLYWLFNNYKVSAVVGRKTT
jgi:hypothetical protein